MKKTIAVVTGTRAEYGLLKNVCDKILKSDKLTLKLIVTGSHLSKLYGNTVDEITGDGFRIDERIDILKYESTPLGTCKMIGLAVSEFAENFEKSRPDLLLVLGDRYGIFAAGTAAAGLGIPIAHISGGDVTLGAADEFFRHSLTKMSALHFPSCEEYEKRVIAMGEEPQRVFNVGGLGDENVRNMKLRTKEELEKVINFTLRKQYFLVTYHPETAGEIDISSDIKNLFKALECFPDYKIIFTLANADAGGAFINEMINEYTSAHENTIAFASMGLLNYLSAMRDCAGVIGNSSSGIAEAPTFGVPTVNIGTRQKGRVRCASIIDCDTGFEDIETAIKKAVTPEFNSLCKQTKSPYDGGDTSGEITRIVTEFLESDLSKTIKTFYDV